MLALQLATVSTNWHQLAPIRAVLLQQQVVLVHTYWQKLEPLGTTCHQLSIYDTNCYQWVPINISWLQLSTIFKIVTDWYQLSLVATDSPASTKLPIWNNLVQIGTN